MQKNGTGTMPAPNEKRLTEEQKFYFYIAIKNSIEANIKRNQKLMLNDFFGRFVNEYPDLCGKKVLGIREYSQIYPSLREFVVFHGRDLQTYMELIEVPEYEERIRWIKDAVPSPWNTENVSYIYARVVSEDREEVVCHPVDKDPAEVRIPFYYIPLFLKRSSAGKYIWLLRIKNDEGVLFIPCRSEDSVFISELIRFAAHHKRGDLVNLPVKYMETYAVCLCIGPTAYVKIPKKTLPDGVRISAGDICTMRVSNIITDKSGKTKVFLYFVRKTGKNDPGAVEINDTDHDIDYIPVSEHIVMHVKEDARIYEALARAVGEEITRENIRQLVTDKYREACGTDMLVIKKKFGAVGISVPLGVRDANGVPLDAYINRNPGRNLFFLAAIVSATPEDICSRLIDLPSLTSNVNDLSYMVLEEGWSFGTYNRYIVLTNFVRISFFKAYCDGKIIVKNGYAVFNTGLVDMNYNSIYGVLYHADGGDVLDGRVWTFLFFAVRGNTQNGKRLERLFSELPDAPVYTDGMVNFDAKKDIVVDYDHIIMDNLERLPVEFLKDCLSFDDDMRDMFSSDVRYRDIKRKISETPGLMTAVSTALEQSLALSLKRAARYYDFVIPIYYPRINSISFAIPLMLTGSDIKNDTASVVFVATPASEESYQVQTVFTPDMCRLDAMQIPHISNRWL